MRVTIKGMTTTNDTVTRYLGNCQLCEGDFKLDGGRMVHHGYKRPGDGMIHGDCPGVYREPYELSCEDIKVAKASYEAGLPGIRAYLARLESNCVTRLVRTEWRGESIEYIAGVTALHSWVRALEIATWDVKNTIRSRERIIARFAERIAAWTLQPIRTIEEEQAKERAAKEERARIVVEKRAVRAAKIAATKAKQEALKAKRKAQHAELAAKIEALAAAKDFAGAADLWGQLCHKPKYRWVEMWDLPKLCGEALVTLRLFKVRKSDGHLIPTSWQD
jgi:hypothetical protein